ncbi:PorV/PorQ family protein [Reichenbachiella versicolor]|uniref:hypothetical protein n=1 Tax=Reichenbachiella versicolor TaxID=1821036 RepID=UPI0013A563C3|nr:hypothetical protein [Reichenbachiella versicolor]
MKDIILIAFVLCLTQPIIAQHGNYEMGARSAAIANSNSTLGDEWALFNNIGGLAHSQTTNLFATYRNPYGLTELSSIAAGISHPALKGVLGLGVYRYGGDELNEHRIHLGYSNKLGPISLGINIGYFQLRIDEGGSTNSFMVDFGGQAQLSNHLFFGAQISNINQSKLSDVTEEKVPTYMKTGISYRPSRFLMLNLDVEKSIDSDLRIKTGIEYMIIEMIYLRTGLTTEPFNSCFGLGFKSKKIGVDYAYSIHTDLGGIHQISFSYLIQE